MSKIYVIGHKSPDTDSIAAAISYSYLKQQQGVEAVAARAGEPNKETCYALDYFKVEAPEYLEKVEAGTKLILVDHNESKQCVGPKRPMYWNSSIIIASVTSKPQIRSSSSSVRWAA